MKIRIVILLSSITLLLIFSFQGIGMYHAYKSQVSRTKYFFSDCFERAFIEAMDGQVNSLPLADGTYTHLIYAPCRLRSVSEEVNGLLFYGAQQTSAILQKIYHMDELPLAVLDSILSCKLQQKQLEGTLTLRKFNAGTGETLEMTSSHIPVGSNVFVSKQAFLYKEKGIAVQAYFDATFLGGTRELLAFFIVTLLSVAIVMFAFVRQMQYIIRQRQSIKEQRENYCALAEKIELPVTEMLFRIPISDWKRIEERSASLFGETEQILSKAKVEEQSLRKRKFLWNMFSFISLPGSLLLVLLWAGYLYWDNLDRVKYGRSVHFGNAFYKEVKHRADLAVSASGGEIKNPADTVSYSPYYQRQAKAIFDFMEESRIPMYWRSISIQRDYYGYAENQYLTIAYVLQDAINRYSKVAVPFSLHYLDSLCQESFGHLFETGIRVLRYPSKEVMDYTGKPSPSIWDMRTDLIPLDRDSTVVVEGVMYAPCRMILASIWYQLLPLGLLFIFICVCFFFLLRILQTQRRLKQFQKDFTYSMIHDMKSPLQSVMMGAHVLSGGKLTGKPEKVEKYRRVMTDECEHLLMLSNRVVMLTQLDRGELELHKEEVLLKPLLGDIAEKFRLKAVKQVLFEINCKEGCTVYADAFCLREVLSNLVDNAIKYSNEAVMITLSGEKTDDSATVRVRDNGIGIPLREQHKIFDKFERVSSNSRKIAASGFGLGLNYVLQVVNAHGGMVKVESIEGSYSEFIIHFPSFKNV